MPEEAVTEAQGMWEWFLAQFGLEGVELGWGHLVLLVLALIGVSVVLRSLLGGRSVSSGSGGSTVAYPQGGRLGGLPTKYYIGSEKLSDFSTPRGVYDFKVPTPTPDLSKLRKPLNMDLNKAKELFIPAGGQRPDSLELKDEGESSEPAPPAGPTLDLEMARKLFVPRVNRRRQ